MTDRCPAARCGGCAFQGVPYPKQLEDKQQKLQKLLGRFCPVLPIIGMDEPLHYRCKVQSAFGRARDGLIISGPYEADSHRIVPIDSCLIENETADEIIAFIRHLMPAFRLEPFNDRTGTGFLRHVLVRVGRFSGEIMVVLVGASLSFPGSKGFVEKLRARFPQITTVVLNRNNRFTSMVLGDEEKTLYGPGFILDNLLGLRFRISPRSFYQVNPIQAEVLYRTAIDFAALTGAETVLDAYCGTGTIGLCAASRAGSVLGVELNEDAVRDARENARRNKIANASFLCRDATRFMTESGSHFDVILMDPPRAGSTPAFIRAAAAASPSRIVYVSCDLDTLARDLALFAHEGYHAQKAQGVDMFPFAAGIETVVLLNKE